jgi:hypothetical protein
MPTYTLIASSTVGSGGAASIDFTSIPSTYTDLVLLVSGRDGTTTSVTSTIYVTFNNTSANRSARYLYGDGSTAGSGSSGTVMFMPNMAGVNATANTFGNGYMYIPNYAGSNNKSSSVDMVPENNGTSTFTAMTANLWSNTSAINRITLTSDGNFAQHSTAYLYGVSNA